MREGSDGGTEKDGAGRERGRREEGGREGRRGMREGEGRKEGEREGRQGQCNTQCQVASYTIQHRPPLSHFQYLCQQVV